MNKITKISSLGLIVFFLSTSTVFAAPPNDDFDNATLLNGEQGLVMGSNDNATTESGEPAHAGNGGPYHSVWWKWAAISNGTLSVSTVGSDFDTVLGIYTGDVVKALTEIASNDDEENSSEKWSKITNNVMAGVTYYFAIDGFSNTNTGNIILVWDFLSEGFTPVNDNFTNATELIGTNGVALGNNVYGTSEDGEPEHAENGGPYHSVWWKWTAAANGIFNVRTEGSTNTSHDIFDTVLGMYTGTAVNALTEIAADDDEENGGEFWSEITTNVISGATYYFAVDGIDDSEFGNIILSWNFVKEIIPLPEITTFEINNLAASTTNKTVILNNSCNNNPAEYMASENSSFVGASWLAYSTAPYFTLTPNSGTKTIYFKVRNSGGESDVASNSILLIVTPEITTFEIDTGAASTTNQTVILNNFCNNNPTEYMVSENSSFIGESWQAYVSASVFMLSAGGGLKTIYFKTRNAAGESTVVSDDITFIVAPNVTDFAINNGDATISNRLVVLNNTANNSPTHYMASEDILFSNSTWKAYSPDPEFFISSAGDGTKTIYFKTKNTAGESIVVFDDIFFQDVILPQSGTGFYMQVVEPDISVGDIFHIQLYSQLDNPWDYICQHIERDDSSHADFSFLNAVNGEIVPEEYFAADFGANLHDVKITIKTNILNGVNDGVVATIECQAEKDGIAKISYITKSGGYNFQTETCALINNIDVLKLSDNHFDGMYDIGFNIKPNKAGILLKFNTDFQHYWTGDTISVSLQLDNLLTTHYDTVSLLLEYDPEMLIYTGVKNCDIIPDDIEIDTLPNGNSNLVSIVASWNETITSTGCLMRINFIPVKSGQTKIISRAPDPMSPNPDFGTMVIKNWMDVLDSPNTWTEDMPADVRLDIRPYKSLAYVAEPDLNNINVGDNVNIKIKVHAVNKARVDTLGISINYDSAHFSFFDFVPNDSLLTNVYWQNAGNYIWMFAEAIDPASNISGKSLGKLVLRGISSGNADVNFQFLPPGDSFSDGSSYALWNGADILGNANNPTDGVIGCSIILEDANALQTFLKVEGKDIVPKNSEYEAAIVAVTNSPVNPDYIEIEFNWDVNKFKYKNYDIVSQTATFSDYLNTSEGRLTIWSDNVSADDCIGTVAVVRLVAVNKGDAKLKLIPPSKSISNGTKFLDASDNDLLGFNTDPDDGIINKAVVITDVEAFHLYFESSTNIISPNKEFFLDIMITNFSQGAYYSNISVMIEYDSKNISITSVSNANLAGGVLVAETYSGNYYSVEFAWPEPTNALGRIVTIQAETANDLPVTFNYAFGSFPGSFPGTYILNGQTDMLGSPDFSQDGIDGLKLENSTFPYGATLHFNVPANVTLGDIFTAEIILSNNSAVKVTSLNILFDFEKDSFEVENVLQGELGGTVTKMNVNHLNGQVHYSETFTQPTLVSGVVCRLKIFARSATGSGEIYSIAPSSEYDKDGTFVRNGNTDVLGDCENENDGGADMDVAIEVSDSSFPSLYLDDYNCYNINSKGSMVFDEVGNTYFNNRDIYSEALVWNIEQIEGDKAELAMIMPIPPYPMLIYPKVDSVGTQIFKVTVTDYENPLLYSYDYVGLIFESSSELEYPPATDKITYTEPLYSYKSKTGKCTFQNGSFTITGGADDDSLIIKSVGNYEKISSDCGLKKLKMQGSLNNLVVNGPLGSVIIKSGNLGNVSAESINLISVTAPRNYVKSESDFSDSIDDPQGLIGYVSSKGDIGTIIVKSGDLGELDFAEDYGQTVISSNGNIGKIIVKGKKRKYFEKGYGITAYLGGGNIYANILAPKGSIKKIFANNNIGWENIDEPAIISAANDIDSINISWSKIRDGDAPTFYANVFSKGDIKRIVLKGAYLGSDDLQTTINANNIGSVICKLWRDYYLDDGDPWVDIYGGDVFINIVAKNSLKNVSGAGDYFTSRILAGADISKISYKGYRDEEGEFYGGDIEDTFVAAGLNINGIRNVGSLKNVKAGNDILNSIFLAGCVYADEKPGYLGNIDKITAKGTIADSIFGSMERPGFKTKQLRERLTYYINGVKK